MPRIGIPLNKSILNERKTKEMRRTFLFLQIQCGFFIWEDVYLLITEGGRVNKESKKQVWWVIIVAFMVIFNSNNEDDPIGKDICKCGGAK